uniref:F-box protein n=1 Tax=Globodera pallida TaxID=36090 RepID=A0A183CHY5_GLOPA
MSDNLSDEEQQQEMEEISICAAVWLKVFAFLDPVELGLKLALISDRLDFLVDEHFKLRKWSLNSLQIRRAIKGKNGAHIVNEFSGEQLPIPHGPLPNNVIDFKWIGISYVDQPVIGFLQRIRRLFDSCGTNVLIDSYDDDSRSVEIIWQNIWPLITDNICSFSLDPSVLDRLRQFSPAILCNCANLRSLSCCYGLFPELPAEDNAGASPGQALAKWLLAPPREDGLPKMLCCRFYSSGMEGLKGAFGNALEPVNFIISFDIDGDDHLVPFELQNILSGERLTFRRFNEDKWLLVRCPIAREETKWAKWEEEALVWPWCWWSRQRNRIFMTFEGSDIGMLDANDEGPR